MQLTTIFTAVLAALAVPASAAPATAAVKSMMAADKAPWIIRSVQRICNKTDATCVWTFSIDTQKPGVKPTPVKYVVNGKPASLASGGPSTFGVYTVTSGVSTQFPVSFTTFSIIDNTARLIAWPAYTETQVADGKVVVPDQSYLPQTLP